MYSGSIAAPLPFIVPNSTMASMLSASKTIISWMPSEATITLLARLSFN